MCYSRHSGYCPSIVMFMIHKHKKISLFHLMLYFIILFFHFSYTSVFSIFLLIPVYIKVLTPVRFSDYRCTFSDPNSLFSGLLLCSLSTKHFWQMSFSRSHSSLTFQDMLKSLKKKDTRQVSGIYS